MPDRTFYLLIGCLVFLGTMLAQGSRGLFESTEGRYGEVAREMRVSGNYLVPTLDGNPHWSKPPFAYWMIAAGMSVFGENAWGARLGSAVSLALGSILLAALAQSFWDRRTAIWAVVIWSTGFLPAGGANIVSTDIYLTAAETFAVWAFVVGWRQRSNRWFILMWIAFGISFLIKGPPSLLPLIPAAVFSWRGRFLKKVFPITGILLFLLIGFSWYLVVIWKYPHLLEYFIKVEVINRVSSNRVHNPSWAADLFLYLPVVVFSLGIWGILAIIHLVKRSPIHRLKVAWRNNEPALFLILWTLIPLAVFCLVKSKLPLYVLPLSAPLALLAARQLRQVHQMRVLWIIGLVSASVIVSAKYFYGNWPDKNNMNQLAAFVEPVLQEEGPSTTLTVFRETKLFGLEFYLERSFFRLTDIDQTSSYPVAMYPIQGFLKGQKQPFLILTRKRHLEELETAASGSGWTFRQLSESRFWKIGYLEPRHDQAS